MRCDPVNECRIDNNSKNKRLIKKTGPYNKSTGRCQFNNVVRRIQ